MSEENTRKMLNEFEAGMRKIMGDTVEKLFHDARFTDAHLGLGDIRLTVGQQEEIVDMVRGGNDD